MTTETTRTFIRSVPLGKDSGKTFPVPLHELLPPAAVAIALDAKDGTREALLRDLLLVGTSRIFVDCQASAKTDAERLGACTKKLDAWREGAMNVRGGIGGGETVEGEVKRLLLAAYMERTGATLAKAEGKLKGRGFEVLRAIADAKAEATLAAEAPGQPAAIEGETEADRAARDAAYVEATTTHLLTVKTAADAFYTTSEAAWRAKAEASLAAKAKARESTGKLDMADLLDAD